VLLFLPPRPLIPFGGGDLRPDEKKLFLVSPFPKYDDNQAEKIQRLKDIRYREMKNERR
jgi:hypothetical protein